MDEFTLVTFDDTDAALDLADIEGEVEPKSGKRTQLSSGQRLQVAVWVVEGLSNSKMQALMAENGIPVINKAAISRYRHNEELLEEAKQYLRREISTVGLSERAIRIRQLQRHADRLFKLIENGGLMETEEKVIGWGKQAQTISSQKFVSSLSKEYRDTIRQIREEVEPLERVVINVDASTSNTFISALSADDREQIVASLLWRPQVVPQIMAPAAIDAEYREVIDADVVS